MAEESWEAAATEATKGVEKVEPAVVGVVAARVAKRVVAATVVEHQEGRKEAVAMAEESWEAAATEATMGVEKVETAEVGVVAARGAMRVVAATVVEH